MAKAAKKPTAKQLAARKKFAAMVKARAKKKTVKKPAKKVAKKKLKTNPIVTEVGFVVYTKDYTGRKYFVDSSVLESAKGVARTNAHHFKSEHAAETAAKKLKYLLDKQPSGKFISVGWEKSSRTVKK